MSRDFSPREFDEFARGSADPGTRAGHEERGPLDLGNRDRVFRPLQSVPERTANTRRPEIRCRAGRAVLYDRDQSYALTESEIRTIVELGKFRVIATEDLIQHAYANDREHAGREVQDLVRQGLVGKRIFEGPEAYPRELLTLTKRGHRFLRKNRLTVDNQATYSGFMKPREANHDANLYLLYQKEAARIEAQGGRNLRVILDNELKRRINRELANFGTAARQEIAARHGLEVVRNKIPIPDLRIEYETRDGEMARVHLELVTEHYRGQQVADKVHAGFSLYIPRGEADRLRRVLDQRKLTAEIVSL